MHCMWSSLAPLNDQLYTWHGHPSCHRVATEREFCFIACGPLSNPLRTTWVHGTVTPLLPPRERERGPSHSFSQIIAIMRFIEQTKFEVTPPAIREKC
ncbi:hypothetical protein AMTRI_Chr12g273010 [Amborella trichopoda]